jgi:hypothetical protein
MTTGPEAASAMAAQPVPGTTKRQAAGAADLTPTVAWSRRVRRIGGFIQAAFAAFWLARASLAIGGRASDALIAVSAVAVIGVFAYAIKVTAGTAPRAAAPTGAPNAFLIAARNSGCSVSAVQFTSRGAILSRPACCSAASLASMLG